MSENLPAAAEESMKGVQGDSPAALSRQKTRRSLPKTWSEATQVMTVRASSAITVLPLTCSSSQAVPCVAPAQ